MSNKKMDVQLIVNTIFLLLLLVNGIRITKCSDITPAVFGSMVDGMPAAFGDFDSNELTDVFVLTNNLKTLEILLASDQEPLLNRHNLSCSFKNDITNVVPGDYDGDVFMDVLVTTDHHDDKSTYVYVIWGGNGGSVICPNESNPLVVMHGQPLAIDYNQDMIIDLFGLNVNNERTFWILNNNRTEPNSIPMKRIKDDKPLARMSIPHSNAFLDLNNDFLPDLMITTTNNFEIWHGIHEGFEFYDEYPLPPGVKGSNGYIGQALYMDFESKGQLELIVPVCFNSDCTNSSIFVYNNGWHKLPINWHETDTVVWGFIPSSKDNYLYSKTITLRGGDFNMDGYPDLLATLRQSPTSPPRTFLFLNNDCNSCKNITRTFEIKWTALNPFYDETIMGVFYDFYQDGILDVILVTKDKNTKKYTTVALRNSLDYDTNFVKVMVLTGLTNSKYPISPGSLGKKKTTYGTNLPGPSIAYQTKTQDGNNRNAIAAQLPQSAYFSLNLPYTTFGLDRTPNFIETLTIGVAGKSRDWKQIIPNSQMVVIPNPINDPTRWRAQLFVTPSKLILLSAGALAGTCILISAIIIGLYWKERREDKIERLQEAHRFHFDAM